MKFKEAIKITQKVSLRGIGISRDSIGDNNRKKIEDYFKKIKKTQGGATNNV